MSKRNVILLCLVSIVACCLIAMRTELRRLNAQLGDARRLEKQLKNETIDLKTQYAQYSTVHRVIGIAEQLNMREPKEDELVDVQ